MSKRYDIFVGEQGFKPDTYLTSNALDNAKDALELYSFSGDYGLILDRIDNTVVVYEEKNK